MLVHLQDQITLLSRLETLHGYLNLVSRHWQQWDQVVSSLVSLRASGNTCVLRGNGYSGARDYTSRRVRNRAEETAGRLPVDKWAERKRPHTQYCSPQGTINLHNYPRLAASCQ